MCYYKQRFEESLLKNYKQLQPEIEMGSNIEYKRYLDNFNRSKLNKRTSQMMNRLCEGYELEGKSKCIYLLGVNDNGSIWGLDKRKIKESMKNMKDIVANCNNNAKIDSCVTKKIKRNRYIIQVNIIADDIEYYYDFLDY